MECTARAHTHSFSATGSCPDVDFLMKPSAGRVYCRIHQLHITAVLQLLKLLPRQQPMVAMSWSINDYNNYYLLVIVRQLFLKVTVGLRGICLYYVYETVLCFRLAVVLLTKH